MQSIDIFPWDEHFNTGVEIIDSQHRKLVEILNHLATHIVNESSEEELAKIFDELTEYAFYHFKAEEEIWNKYLLNDSMNKKHKEVHQQFVDTVKQLKSEQNIKPFGELAEQAIVFLVKWLASHILDSDRHMAYIIFALQDGQSLEEAKASAENKMSDSSHILINIILSIYSTLSSNTLSLMREIKAHRIFDKKVNYQEEYRKLLLNISTSFINLPLNMIDSEINNSLENMAKFVGADRAYIFDYDIRAQTTSNTYEWCADGISQQIDNLQNLPIDISPEWLEIHVRGESILVEDIVALPAGKLRDLMLSKEIKSLVTFPLMKNSICKGFVGFETVKRNYLFSKNDIELFELFSKLLVNVNDRKQIESELYQEKNLLKTLIQTIPDLVWLKDSQGTYLTCNMRVEDYFGAKEEEIVGKSDYDFMDKKYADICRIDDEKAINSAKVTVNEEEVSFASDGHKETLQTTKVPMYDFEGKLIGILGIARDITEHTKISNDLKNERLMLETILDNAPIGIWMSISGAQMKFVNKTFCEATGITEEEFLSTSYDNLLPQDVSPNCMKSDAECVLLDSGVHTSTEVLPFTDGKEHVLEITKVKLDTADGEVGVIGLAVDITERQQQQRHLEYIAHYDALTGLPNRVLLSDRMHQALAQTNRHKQSLAVVYLDLDGFKAINDTYGHDNGDKLLTILSGYMKDTLREGDTIARLGGDEFVAVLMDLETHEDSFPMLKRLLLAISQRVIINDIEMQLTGSLGVAFYDAGDELDSDQLLRQADQAMYQAKLFGKNRYYIFDSQKDKKIRTQHESLEEIENALIHNEFVLHYQPKVNMRSGKVVGAEALIRWNHPNQGLLAPGRFLPIIEGHVLCVRLGEWVLNRAMKQIAELKSQGINIPISVNIDAMQLQQNDFVEMLESLLIKYPTVKPKDVILEILETSALEDISHVSHIMYKCKEIGVLFSLDDFGTGYSSLTYLKRLPVKELKIDQSFVHGMLEDPDDLAILDGVLGLASAFRRDSIAEGVETIEHGEMLLKLGCEIAQGYVIARPMSPENILPWIEQYKTDEKWKNTLQISRDDLPLLYALVEHKAWLNNVLAYLQNRINTPPKLNHHECRFGEWLYEGGISKYGNNFEFEEVEKMHRKVHKKTNFIIKQHKSKSIKNLEASIKEIKKLSKDLTSTFKKFEATKRDTVLLEL